MRNIRVKQTKMVSPQNCEGGIQNSNRRTKLAEDQISPCNVNFSKSWYTRGTTNKPELPSSILFTFFLQKLIMNGKLLVPQSKIRAQRSIDVTYSSSLLPSSQKALMTEFKNHEFIPFLYHLFVWCIILTIGWRKPLRENFGKGLSRTVTSKEPYRSCAQRLIPTTPHKFVHSLIGNAEKHTCCRRAFTPIPLWSGYKASFFWCKQTLTYDSQ